MHDPLVSPAALAASLWKTTTDLRHAIATGDHESGALDVPELADLARFCGDLADRQPAARRALGAIRCRALSMVQWAAGEGMPGPIRRAALAELDDLASPPRPEDAAG